VPNVVLIAYHYPPDPAVGSLRAAKVANALRDAGYEITVITARLPNDPELRRQSEPGIKVIPVEPLRSPRDWYAARKQKRKAPGAAPTTHEGAYLKPVRTPLWKRMIFSLLWLPDDRQGFIIPAIRAARSGLRQTGTIVYTTAPPFSSALVGWWLSRKKNVRWVAEFRDPWVDNPWKPAHVRTGLSNAAERFMERRVLHSADLVVAASKGIERTFRPKMADRGDRLIVIRNGIDKLMPQDTAPTASNGPVRIVHVGSFYHGRDPRPFLRGLAGVSKDLGPGRLQVDLVGQSRWFAGQSVEKEVESLGLTDVVRFHDWVPHARAQEFIASADALLLLAQNQPDQVPNKLYEYLGARRVILAYVDESGETASMLRQIGGHYLVTDDNPEATKEALVHLAARAEVAHQANEEALREWTAQAQMRTLTARLGAL
jgi:glycosyltransferase involved in cell wall biosynthesis